MITISLISMFALLQPLSAAYKLKANVSNMRCETKVVDEYTDDQLLVTFRFTLIDFEDSDPKKLRYISTEKVILQAITIAPFCIEKVHLKFYNKSGNEKIAPILTENDGIALRYSLDKSKVRVHPESSYMMAPISKTYDYKNDFKLAYPQMKSISFDIVYALKPSGAPSVHLVIKIEMNQTLSFNYSKITTKPPNSVNEETSSSNPISIYNVVPFTEFPPGLSTDILKVKLRPKKNLVLTDDMNAPRFTITIRQAPNISNHKTLISLLAKMVKLGNNSFTYDIGVLVAPDNKNPTTPARQLIEKVTIGGDGINKTGENNQKVAFIKQLLEEINRNGIAASIDLYVEENNLAFRYHSHPEKTIGISFSSAVI